MAHGSSDSTEPNQKRGRGRPRKTPIGSQEWQCVACDTRIITHVPLTEAPRCTRHTGGPRAMKLVRTVTE